jgi:hypothetical protein
VRVTAATITDEQLRALFARHCECRPLDLNRTEDDHAAIHDCDTGVLADIQCALSDARRALALLASPDADDAIERRHAARARCADIINDYHGGKL